jgi:hypothetical protein
MKKISDGWLFIIEKVSLFLMIICGVMGGSIICDNLFDGIALILIGTVCLCINVVVIYKQE